MLEEASSGAKTVFYVTFMCMMLFFFMVAALSEKYKPSIGHETSYTIILGIVLSVILWYSTRDGSTLAADFKFSPSFFLDFMLPPLIFNSGYTMHKKKFF
jgi:NhaP-type Na+/H+ or K+/H+ antiporter